MYLPRVQTEFKAPKRKKQKMFMHHTLHVSMLASSIDFILPFLKKNAFDNVSRPQQSFCVEYMTFWESHFMTKGSVYL